MRGADVASQVRDRIVAKESVWRGSPVRVPVTYSELLSIEDFFNFGEIPDSPYECRRRIIVYFGAELVCVDE